MDPERSIFVLQLSACLHRAARGLGLFQRSCGDARGLTTLASARMLEHGLEVVGWHSLLAWAPAGRVFAGAPLVLYGLDDLQSVSTTPEAISGDLHELLLALLLEC